MDKFLIAAALAIVLALPFMLRQKHAAGSWRPGDPSIVVVTPHNEAIRQEFAEAFASWHQEHFGQAARIDWRVIGGTSEIMRYLGSEYVGSSRRFAKECAVAWPPDGAEVLLRAQPAEGTEGARLWQLLRESDSPQEITSHIDLFFGGGVYDHAKAERQGFTVPAWGARDAPAGIFEDSRGRTLIPEGMHGEVWRGNSFYGNVLSTFGICYNVDRLADLGIESPPQTWVDLADERYAGALGLSDPTKSGSVAKAFEMIVHERCARHVAACGYSRQMVRDYEARLAAGADRKDAADVPAAYHEAVAQGWVEGIRLVRRIGANARYFTDASGKVPADVRMGAAAAGVVIDFYGRLQVEMTTPPGHKPVMAYITPLGGSCVTADPVSLLRGAPNRAIAVRFIEFLLGEEGQRLWNYRIGTPGGPQRFALRRLPIRRDFYPSSDPDFQRICEQHQPHLSDPLWQPEVDAYRLGEAFHYEPRWTGRHFDVQRELIRAMCMDSGDELKRAWSAILAHGGPAANPAAMQAFEALPDTPWPLTWSSAIEEYATLPRLEMVSAWTAFFRRQYREAERLALQNQVTAGIQKSP